MSASTSTDPLDDKEGADRPPGRSGTPTAWAALAVIVVVAGIWMFADVLTCLALRAGIAAASWHRGESVQIARLFLNAQGNIEAHGVEWSRGPRNHRSTIKSDWVILRPAAPRSMLFPKPGEKRLWIRELALGKTRLLLDFRGGAPGDFASQSSGVSGAPGFPPLFLPPSLLPASLAAGPVNAVLIGEGNRLEANDLWVMLPARWPGRVSFRTLTADCGSWHRSVSAASCEALWENGSLRLGSLGLGEGLSLGELTLKPAAARLEFGLRGIIGKGLLRGDGSLGVEKNHADLEFTLVGERLGLEAFNDLLAGEKRATGLISQARFTFRGDPARPLEADGSARVIAKNFRWEGRGWESLRLAATLTGRTLSVSELSLRQGENEVEAEGRSTLPGDWRLILRAPFSANFRAQLEDAGALSALTGSELPGLGSLGGGLSLEGEIHGADNRAEGYCNLSGSGMRLRELPLDWVKGWLLFEGDKTHLLSLMAQSGADRLELKGTVGNSRPHAYEGSAEVSVANFFKRLAQIGMASAAVNGGGALTGTWQGAGSMTNHAGTFQARVTDWVGRWTPSGITGNFEGAYAPGHLELSKAEFRQGNLRLALRMNATPQSLTVSGISARREEKTKPLLEGSFILPVDGTGIFQSGSMLGTLAMDRPLVADLHLHGLPAGEFADLLGQKAPFGGLLEGDLNIGGTPAMPDLHIEIKASQFTPHGEISAGDLTLGAQTSEGKTVVKLAMEPAASTPLEATASLPLRLAMKGDTLRLADDEEPLSGNATLRGLPIDSWSGFFGWSKDGMLRKAVADGEITLSGSARKPVFAGRVVLRATESTAINGQSLRHLELPFTLDGGKATLGEKATAIFAGKPVSLGGSIDWTEGSFDTDLTVRGSGLAISVGEGISTTASAELRLTRRGGKDPLLSGTVTLQPASTDLKRQLVPAFVPPALFQPIPAEEKIDKKATSGLQLDLAVTTAPREAVPGSGPLITMDLHLKGSPEAPLVNGTITALNQSLLLPAGSFVLPSAKVTVEQSMPRLDEGTACGFTRAGFCALSPTGSLTAPAVSLNGYGAISAPDLIMDLASPPRKLSSTALIRQGRAWLRQEAIRPLPASDWITRRLGIPEAGSLGFYGSPWNWTATQATPTQQAP
jgi:hypothetical protein